MIHKEKKLNTEIARMCGTNAGVIAALLWELQADADAVRYIDGYPWMRASYKRMTVYLPFLTVHMVRTSVKKLLKEGVIKVGVYNDSRFDHTHSYAFTGYGIDLMRAYRWVIYGNIRSGSVLKTADTGANLHRFAGTA
jgi:hypothetical protein